MAPEIRHAKLPSALREPLSRNVQLLVGSRVPVRLAWNDAAGKPRVAPLWFRWTGSTLELSTFAESRKLDELHNGDAVAVTIDTEDFPYGSLRIRGPVTIEHVQGLTSARRYLGEGPARDRCNCAMPIRHCSRFTGSRPPRRRCRASLTSPNQRRQAERRQ
jgi:hypothetical protein